jgi:hypothetical protein
MESMEPKFVDESKQSNSGKNVDYVSKLKSTYLDKNMPLECGINIWLIQQRVWVLK